MGDKIVFASNHIDKHRHVMTEEALQSMVTQINGDKKIPMLMNHRRELPPLGRHGNAELLKEKASIYVVAEIEEYQSREEINIEGSQLVKESFNEPARLSSRYNPNITSLNISLDPANFETFGQFEETSEQIAGLDSMVDLQMHGRKSDVPFPEILFQVGGAVILVEILKTVGRKLIEEVTEDLYDESKKRLKSFKEYVVRTLKIVRKKAIPKNRVLNVIFEIHETPFIELIAKTDDPTLIEKGLRGKELLKVRDSIIIFQRHFTIDKIQFKLNEKGSWKFNYLTTLEGDAIGIKETFRERDKQYQRYKLQQLDLKKRKK
jgi:hypothetical protein